MGSFQPRRRRGCGCKCGHCGDRSHDIGTTDPHSFLGQLHTREGRFGQLSGTERCDRLLEKGQATVDPQLRHAIYRQLEALVQQDACVIPLFHPQTYRFGRPEIEGLEVSHGGPMVAYEELAAREEG